MFLDVQITEAEIAAIKAKVADYLSDASAPLALVSFPRARALSAMRGSAEANLPPPLHLPAEKLGSKLSLMNAYRVDPVPVIQAGDLWDITFGPMCVDKAIMRGAFDITAYRGGLLIVARPTLKVVDRPHLWATFMESARWTKVLKAGTVMDVNKVVMSRDTCAPLVWVAEALHEEKMGIISRSMAAHPARVGLIAGPSSSGKTTFAKRLAIHLAVSGLEVLTVSMDDYYLDVDKMPTNDFEDISGLDLPLLFDRIGRLVKGETIPVRRFDFRTGKGSDDPVATQSLCKTGGYILMEGIHALNPLVCEGLTINGAKPQRIFISAVTPLRIDDQHACSTADTRLIRRLVRDYKFRGYSAIQTISRWPSVRAGEEKWIYPYQETADYWFNSSLCYEHNALTVVARALLCEVDEALAGPVVAAEAKRLETYLSLFYPMETEGIVPFISINREFIGQSGFTY